MFDAAPFQIVAHGFVPSAQAPGPIAAFTNGVASVTNLGTGEVRIILDEGLPGGGTVDLEDVRLFLTIATIPVIGGAPGSIDGLAANPGGGPTEIIVQTWNAFAGTRINAAFWFAVGRPVESLS